MLGTTLVLGQMLSGPSGSQRELRDELHTANQTLVRAVAGRCTVPRSGR